MVAAGRGRIHRACCRPAELSRLAFNWQQAGRHLRAACPCLGKFIEGFGSGRYYARPGNSLFEALAESIVYQQLSGQAAATIHGRFEALFEARQVNPRQARELGFERLRACGLSRAKALAILDLAAHQLDGSLPTPRQLGRMSDGQIVEQLTRVRGIGPWTVQMHLIFGLGRPDVMPVADLGVQKGVQRVYGLHRLPTPAEVSGQTAHLAPYRSVAAWYFWRACEAPA